MVLIILTQRGNILKFSLFYVALIYRINNDVKIVLYKNDYAINTPRESQRRLLDMDPEMLDMDNSRSMSFNSLDTTGMDGGA